ncbi:RDD family protein [Tenacibaculum amylolyticum]|uniref:RDD family protein n=1 Tax=Tenacibaculum amylolyticum TaxID=104269 RepID=UPI0038957A9B
MKRIFSIVVSCVAILFFIMSYFFWSSFRILKDQEKDEWGMYLYITITVTSLIGIWLWKLGKKLRVKSLEERLKVDLRSPILYLRSFQDDKIGSKSLSDSILMKILPKSIPHNVVSEEEQIEMVMSRYGPFIAIGNPRELLPQLGAYRTYTTNESWKNEIINLIGKAQLYILRVGKSEGFWWEVRKVIENGEPEKIIFLLPKKKKDYLEFKEKIDKLLIVPIEAAYIPNETMDYSFGGVLWFNEFWKPEIQAFRFRFDNVNYTLASDLQKLLQPVFDKTYSKRKLSSISKRFLAFIIDVLFFTISIVIAVQILNRIFTSSEAGLGLLIGGVFYYYFYFGVIDGVITNSLGKKICKIKTKDKEGVPISLYQGGLRAFLKFLSVVSPLFIVSLVLVFLKKTSVHDKLTRSRVFEE